MLTKNLRVCGHKVPLYPLFMVSGAVCDVFQALIDYFISKVYTLDYGRTTVCWTLSYTLSIILRHSSHRLLVFGDYEGTYCMSLTRTYMAYSSAIVISMFANHQLVHYGLGHREAWVITMLFTGVYNFLVLKKSWNVVNKATGKLGEDGQPNKLPLPVKLGRDRSASVTSTSGNRDRTTSVEGASALSNRERTVSGGESWDTEDRSTPSRKRSNSMRLEGTKPLTTMVQDPASTSKGWGANTKEKDSSKDLTGMGEV